MGNQSALIDRGIALIRRSFAAIGKAFHSLTESKDAIPYCVFFPGAPNSLPSGFSVSKYPGLLFCHVLRETSESKVVTYWVDQAHFQAHGADLQSFLSLSSPCLSGFAVSIRPQKAWWRRSIENPILALGALIGALTVIFTVFGTLYGQWLLSPDVVISHSELTRLDCLENGPIILSLNVSSRVQSGSTKVLFRVPALESDSPKTSQVLKVDTADFEAGSLLNLGPGQSVHMDIRATAPQLQANQNSPERYALAVEATVEAGKLWSPKTVRTGNREIRVWPSGLRKPSVRVVSHAGNSCVLEGTLYLSKPYPKGLRAEITATGSVGEVTDANVAPTATEVTKLRDSAGTTVKMEFDTPAFNQFQAYRYTVYLDLSQPATDHACTEWATRMDTRFQ